jgi:hypothetical protein
MFNLSAGAMLAAADTAFAVAPDEPWTSRGSVQVAGGRMHWASLGTGEALVLLPKLGG